MKTEKAYFAGGCFWCLEASFKLVPGVISANPGYTGGTTEYPTYEQVCSGKTGHAEATEIEYDPKKVSYGELLNIFFKIHDPSQENRQGNDVGSQYRSAIFYTSEEQRGIAEEYLQNLRDAGEYDTVCTELRPLEQFWPAEAYHQDYFEKHPSEAYCQAIIRPKVEKTRKALEEHSNGQTN